MEVKIDSRKVAIALVKRLRPEAKRMMSRPRNAVERRRGDRFREVLKLLNMEVR